MWFNAVIRTEEGKIVIGENSNIQDNCTLHTDSVLTIGGNVTIGHGAIVHCSSIGNNCLIGMGAIILNGAKIGDNCIIGAGALVKENDKIPDNSVVLGIPGKVKRNVAEEEKSEITKNAMKYLDFATKYKNGEYRQNP